MELPRNKVYIALIILFVFTLFFRLHFTLTFDTYSSGEAYFHERIIHTLLEDKKLLFVDELSYGGRSFVYPPFFYILLAFLSLGSSFLLKIIPEILASSTVIIAYFLCYEVSDHRGSALLGASLVGFLPLFLWETTNVLSPNTLFIPLLYLTLYSLLKIEKKKYFWIFSISCILLPFTSPHAYIFVLTLLFYFFLEAGGALTPSKAEKEASLIAVFAILLFSLILYKKVFMAYGLGFFWQSIPSTILAERFRELSVLELILATGIIPLALGGISLYFGLSKEKNKSVYLISSLILAALTLLTFRIITISTGLLFLGLGLAIISPLAISKLYHFLEVSKFSKFKHYTTVFLVLLVLALTIYPAYTHMTSLEGIDEEIIEDMEWIQRNTPQDTVILGNLEEGHIITQVAQRKNVIDNKFLLAPRPIERIRDVDTIYTTWSQAKAMEYLKKYNIKVIYLSEESERIYGIRDLPYAEGACFKENRRFYFVLC